MASLDTDRTHRLGGRAFLLFFGRGLLITLVIAGLIAATWWYGSVYVPKQYVIFYVYGLKLAAVLLLGYFLFKLSHAYLAYRSHQFRFDDEYFHITRGYINREETGVVYHQIQTVAIERPLGARMVGVAHLTVIMSGAGKGEKPAHLPALDLRRARMVQKELLARARRHQQGERQQGYRPVPFEDYEEEDDDE